MKEVKQTVDLGVRVKAVLYLRNSGHGRTSHVCEHVPPALFLCSQRTGCSRQQGCSQQCDAVLWAMR